MRPGEADFNFDAAKFPVSIIEGNELEFWGSWSGFKNWICEPKMRFLTKGRGEFHCLNEMMKFS